MLKRKLFIGKFIHKISGIISFDCHCSYADTQQHSTRKLGNVQKRKLHVQQNRRISAGIFITPIICSMFHLKEKQKTFPSLYGMWLQKREQKEFLCYKKVLVDDKKTNPRFLLANVAVHDKTN